MSSWVSARSGDRASGAAPKGRGSPPAGISGTPTPPGPGRKRAAISKAALPASRIAAIANSATGTALASAAEATRIPRRQSSGVTRSRTVPAACATSRSAGQRPSSASSKRGLPQPVTAISASARERAASDGSPVPGR